MRTIIPWVCDVHVTTLPRYELRSSTNTTWYWPDITQSPRSPWLIRDNNSSGNDIPKKIQTNYLTCNAGRQIIIFIVTKSCTRNTSLYSFFFFYKFRRSDIRPVAYFERSSRLHGGGGNWNQGGIVYFRVIKKYRTKKTRGTTTIPWCRKDLAAATGGIRIFFFPFFASIDNG